MTAPKQLRRARSPLGRWRALLLLGLLAGLLGMHALGPADAVASGGHSSHHSAAVPAHAGMEMAGAAFICHGDGSGGGHAQHADATCASGAIGAGPVLPAPMPDPVGSAPPADHLPGAFAAAPDGGRAPPTLAELQLLRI
ncbi:hypothetical protein GCM10010145_17560 [Streptomyces ruber]|uniref:Uncharacterized protein n=2 Tax=Streptomyces TaxID=1883 RepID=A0A918B9M0_9ACTN|nr:DUF6153 family protein [Streptomyces ruber]GGQ49200.1 hypothetical protein GCM10010145_17560 [Streptomyces ruber]